MRDVDGRVQKVRVDVSYVPDLLTYLDTTPVAAGSSSAGSFEAGSSSAGSFAAGSDLPSPDFPVESEA
jgi:hypothetical protein